MREHPIRTCSVAATLSDEFPTLRFERGEAREGDAVIDVAAWAASTSFTAFDAAVENATTDRLVLEGDPRCAIEVLTRYQRFLERRVPGRVLAAHRALHALEKPLVRADYDHALDTWQWMLRLAPDASAALQLAALFHDVERLESEADARVEHRASSYVAFKDKHAQRGSDIAFDVLVGAGVDRSVAARTRELVACHERRGDDEDIALLNDADGLSFFSLNSSGYVDYFGAAQTRRKIDYTLGRMGPGARSRLAGVRLRPDVGAIFGAVVRG